jgi:hypothetical protein
VDWYLNPILLGLFFAHTGGWKKMNFQQMKRAAIGFLADIKDQLGAEKFLEFLTSVGLPVEVSRLNKVQVQIVQQLAEGSGADLEGYLPQEAKPKKTNNGRKADPFALYEKHPKTGEVMLITDERTVETVIKQIQRVDPDVASQIDWDDYGWTFLVSYTAKIQIWQQEIERKDGSVILRDLEMSGTRSFPDYIENGQVVTAGWRTSVPAEVVLRQEIGDWEVIPYDRANHKELATVTSMNTYHEVFIPTTPEEIKAWGWHLTKITNQNDVSGYFAEDPQTGRVKQAKPSAANAEKYFGYSNTKQKTKSKHNSGGKSPSVQNLPDHLQTASRVYNLRRIRIDRPAKRFYLFYADGRIWLKTNHRPEYVVANIKWSDIRDSHIPIPAMPLAQGDNQRVWDCVLSYLGLTPGARVTKKIEALREVVTTEVITFPYSDHRNANKNAVGSADGKPTGKRAARLNKKQQGRSKALKSFKRC